MLLKFMTYVLEVMCNMCPLSIRRSNLEINYSRETAPTHVLGNTLSVSKQYFCVSKHKKIGLLFEYVNGPAFQNYRLQGDFFNRGNELQQVM